MFLKNIHITLCSLLILVPVSVNAAIINLSADIDGSQANAGMGSGSLATGSATMTFDDVTNEFNWVIEWTGLADVTLAHFHGPALPNQNAGVQVGIDVSSNPTNGVAVLTDQQESDLLAGLWYINIHTESFPGGEIRGQVLVDVPRVPVPAAAWLFASGLLGLIGMARHKAG